MRGICFLVVVAAVGLTACQAPGPRGPARAAAPVPHGNVELIAYLGNQPFVTAEAGYRAAYLLHAGESFDGDFAALREELRTQALINPHWRHAAGDRLNRGEVGYLMCRAAEIEQSLNWRLLRLGRYAYRDLRYLGIAGPGGEFGLMSGGEFQGILRRTEDYMENDTITLGQPQARGA